MGVDVVIESEIKKLSEIEGLYDNEEEKIIAIDPDFVEWNLDGETIKSIKNLKVIVSDSTSFSWLDIDTAREVGVTVVNTRNFSSQAVAEWNLMMVLNLFRKVPILIKEGFKLDYTAHQGYELKGRTAGVVGLGNIGTAFAELAKGVGMDVKYWSKSTKNGKFQYAELDELFKTSDAVFICFAVNEETQKLVTDELINSMKSYAVIVTCIEPEKVMNLELVLGKVKKKELLGFGFEDKPENFNNYEGNIWAAPALAWDTGESIQRDAEKWLENIKLALKGEYPNKVN